jgi:hypothetical protein
MKQAAQKPNMLIDIKHKFIKDLNQHKIINIPTIEMRAHILTKIMPGPTFVRLRTMIGINPPTCHEWWSVRQNGLKMDFPV